MPDYFSLPYFLKLIHCAKRTIRVMDYKRYKKGLILRHDIDSSLDLAWQLSEIESAIGVTASYYIQLTTDVYNPFSFSSRDMLDKMLSNGFEVGLHFDPMSYGKSLSDRNLITQLSYEIERLSKLLGTEVKSYSLHNPGSFGRYIRTEGMIGAYDEEIFGDDKYFSDSNYTFSGKDPLEWVKKSHERLIQLASHPILYLTGGAHSFEEPLKYMMQSYYVNLDKYLHRNWLYRKEHRGYEDIEIKVNRD